MAKSITIDRTKSLREEPEKGHNRWHPDIPPVLEVEPLEEVALETRESSDGQIRPDKTAADLLEMDPKAVHPLTGPVYVKGAEPGDLLEVEYLKIIPAAYGWTRFLPGFGFLHDLFDYPYLVHWDLTDEMGTSNSLPGIRIPNNSFMGTAGVAPSHRQLEEWAQREAECAERGGVVFKPDPESAIPNVEPIASQGLRTIPPRENGGNTDVKLLTQGSRLLLSVNVDGALYSAGDGHFAQGDSECCGTAIEMDATVVVRFRIHKGEAARLGIRWPRYAHPEFFAPPEQAVPRNFAATMGMPVTDDGVNEYGNVTLAARNAVLRMIDLLEQRGWSREQAYVICSVAVDLRINNLVDVPNVIVSAVLPEEIFHG